MVCGHGEHGRIGRRFPGDRALKGWGRPTEVLNHSSSASVSALRVEV
jgi:hypothetical protein